MCRRHRRPNGNRHVSRTLRTVRRTGNAGLGGIFRSVDFGASGLVAGTVHNALGTLLGLVHHCRPARVTIYFSAGSPAFHRRVSTSCGTTHPPVSVRLMRRVPCVRHLIATLNVPLLHVRNTRTSSVVKALTRHTIRRNRRIIVSANSGSVVRLIGSYMVLRSDFANGIASARTIMSGLNVVPGRVVSFLALVNSTSSNVGNIPNVNGGATGSLLIRCNSVNGVLGRVNFVGNQNTGNLVRRTSSVPFGEGLTAVIASLTVNRS